MAKKSRSKGYSSDLSLAWVSEDFGPDWLQWQRYAADWISKEVSGVDKKLSGLKHLFTYLKNKAPYASDVASMFKGHQSGHRVSSEEYNSFLEGAGSNADNYKFIAYAKCFCDFILEHYLYIKDDNQVSIPLFSNPFQKIKRTTTNTESVFSPLPYRYIQQLRQILCPYPTVDSTDKKPWLGRHFKDWTWAIDNLQHGSLAWMKVSPDLIDSSDPDCIARTRMMKRHNKQIEVHEIWSPVVAMFIFTKLHLPLRSFQVRFLDSGEGDTWRYEQGQWVENTRHEFKYGSPKRPYQKGVFRRIYDSISENYSTGLYVSTNKTADQNKDAIQRGYTIPWQHEELLYWLEKLRNWQEKYNPIDRLVIGADLKRATLNRAVAEKQLKEMGEFAFLFRKPNSCLPLTAQYPANPWYRLLLKLEDNLFSSGQTLSNGDRLRFVKNYGDDYKGQETAKVVTDYPLHSLRVSLITCYTMETELPLPVISKLLAGHTRLLMTIYYNKITPSVMAEKMNEASTVLMDKGENSLRNFLVDAELNQIQLRTASHSVKNQSIEAALASRNPIGWEERVTGLCLVGGNSVRSDQLSTIGGCWNGGDIIRDSGIKGDRVYGPVPHGPENCVRCRWHITDATYLPALNSRFNQISYKAYQAAELANEIEAQLEALKDQQFLSEEAGEVFIKQSELQALESRYEKQRVEADEYAKDFIATFNLISRIMQIENQRGDNESQKLIAVGSADELSIGIKFIETNSELLHLSLLCEDAEFHPALNDDLRKTPAITKRTNLLSRMMAASAYQPVFLEMDEKTQLIAGNAVMRKMAQFANPNDKLEGYRTVANYIEAREYLIDSHLLDYGLDEMEKIIPLSLSGNKKVRVSQVESA